MAKETVKKNNIMNLKQFKYWLRINGFLPDQFGTGTKRNPIKLTTKYIFSLSPCHSKNFPHICSALHLNQASDRRLLCRWLFLCRLVNS